VAIFLKRSAKRPAMSMLLAYDLTAIVMAKRALAITEKVLGPEHPQTGTNLNHLAGLLREKVTLTRLNGSIVARS
jgi:hypothetical protein